jgi:hypothetical protein
MILLLLHFALASISIKHKENVCFFLANGAQKDKVQEFKSFINDHPEINKRNLYTKLIEDNFYKCLNSITDEETKILKRDKNKNLKSFLHLVDSKYEDYLDGRSLENSEQFKAKRNKIQSRANRKSSSKSKNEL